MEIQYLLFLSKNFPALANVIHVTRTAAIIDVMINEMFGDFFLFLLRDDGMKFLVGAAFGGGFALNIACRGRNFSLGSQITIPLLSSSPIYIVSSRKQILAVLSQIRLTANGE
jgi:hypothetical protein